MTEKRKYANRKMPRRASREAIFKLLFISEFYSWEDMASQEEFFFGGAGSDILEHYSLDGPCTEDMAYINEKVCNIKNNMAAIDELLNKTSEGWKTSRMSKVDLCVLRLAVYEMLYDESVPVSVAINEAVEIAKNYGGDDSGSFVNGILGKIAKVEKE